MGVERGWKVDVKRGWKVGVERECELVNLKCGCPSAVVECQEYYE